MKHREIVKSIQFIIPDAEFILAGDELTWLDQNNTKPTKKEIEAGWIAYQAAEEAKLQAKLEAKAIAQEKLAALGLTVEDLTALGL